MKILFIAPHPFYQNRGTPIDDLLALRVLSERRNTHVDLLTFNEGEDVSLKNLEIHRIPKIKYAQNMRPGFSLKKLFCDAFLFFKALVLLSRKKYNVIHAVEETVFFALFFKFIYKIPYVYDLDSSIAQQLVESKPLLKPFSNIFNWLEGYAIRHSLVNLPVCNALVDLCKQNGSKKTVVIHDISQLKNPYAKKTGRLKMELAIDKMLIMYIGNLEHYQGIDLLLESFQLTSKCTDMVDLVIIGGIPEDIVKYKEKAHRLDIEKRTHFLGPKPLEMLDQLLIEGDILAVPRIRGINTPMKLFPFLHSGIAVLATDLPTHTQIISKREAYLASPNPIDFSKGIMELVVNDRLRSELGENGRKFVEKNHTYTAHQERLHGVYDWIEKNI